MVLRSRNPLKPAHKKKRDLWSRVRNFPEMKVTTTQESGKERNSGPEAMFGSQDHAGFLGQSAMVCEEQQAPVFRKRQLPLPETVGRAGSQQGAVDEVGPVT